tara:strand:+ start:4156 stop:4764 length:609 start_codon:yes stop_codon:yes gene_type:complete
MTPRQYTEHKEAEKLRKTEEAEAWHVPLSRGRMTLPKALKKMDSFRLNQDEVPLRIQLVENPKYDVGLFAGNVSLYTHDCIHLLLGRGVRPKDEAFVIGYTMGSTKKMARWRRNLFMFCAKYFYPKGYRFGEEERFVFNMGVALGEQNNDDLTEYPFDECLMTANYSLSVLRQGFVNVDLLRNYYKVEKSLFPNSIESQRLI